MPLAFLFPFSCMAIWAGNGIVSKLAVGVLSPAALAWSRWMVAALVLTPFLARRAWRMRDQLRAGFSRLAMLALLGMVLNQTFGYYAAQTLGATEIGLMMGLTPLMTVLLSIWLLRERPTWGALIGGVISILGLAILLGQGDPTRLFTQGIHIGSVYMLLSAATYALYSVLLKRWDLGLDNWSMLLCGDPDLGPLTLALDAGDSPAGSQPYGYLHELAAGDDGCPCHQLAGGAAHQLSPDRWRDDTAWRAAGATTGQTGEGAAAGPARDGHLPGRLRRKTAERRSFCMRDSEPYCAVR